MTGMTVEEAVCDMVRMTKNAGKWKPGDRFWVQVRAYTADAVLLRFFNIETAEKFDRVYPRGDTPGAPDG
jgi:hypothetical protein